MLEYELAAAGGAHGLRLSEEFLNWAADQCTGQPADGAFFSDALHGVLVFGVCEESLMPYASQYDPSAAPSAAALSDAAARVDVCPHWVKYWDVNTGMTTGMLAAMRSSLADGHPVAIGLRWPNAPQYDAQHVLAMPPPGGVFDGHSVVLVGYQTDPGRPGGGTFIFRNSSGPAWGEAGYARMPYEYARLYGNDAVGLRVGDAEAPPCNRWARAPIQLETLAVVDRRDCNTVVQPMDPWCALLWSGGVHLFGGAGLGGSLALSLPVAKSARFLVDLYATRAPDYGVLRVSLDGAPFGEDFDGYGPQVEPSGRVRLGLRDLAAGQHLLRFDVVDKNRASAGYRFGVDCLDLLEQAGPPVL